MSTVAKPQPISGVSAERENVIMVVWPSIAAGSVGRTIGRICDFIPVKINGIKLSYLLFALPLAPIALLLYLVTKVSGDRYVLTNRALEIRAALGRNLYGQVPLTQIDGIAIDRKGGQAFYHAGDLVVHDAAGNEVLRLAGVPRPDVFRQIILEARDARSQTAASLAVIAARRRA